LVGAASIVTLFFGGECEIEKRGGKTERRVVFAW